MFPKKIVLPITQKANENLAYDDAANFKVLCCSYPCFVTRLELGPAGRPDCREKRGQVADREQDIAESMQSV